MKKTKFLLLLCLCSLLLCSCGEKADPTPAAAVSESADAALTQAAEVPAESQPEPADVPAVGTLLESGSGLNENYYNGISCFGAPSDLTENSFLIGKVAMAFDGNAQAILSPMQIFFDENTAVKTAILKDDTYEIYASSLSEMEQYFGDKAYTFDIFLADPQAEKPLAKEIRISKFIFG